VVDLKVSLVDGASHDVDSSAMAFEIAARTALREALQKGGPVLLEPIMTVEITVPDEFAGTIMGDLNSRRGRIQGMDNKAGNTIVKADVQGRHKKQTGGHSQFGDCKIKMEPLPRGAEFEFVNDIFGGAIPRNFIPAVEKGIKDAAARGFLAGYPVVNFRVILYDGSYHDVDSNDLSFQMAGRIAFRKAMEVAKPTLLEPIMTVEITVPDEFAGTIMGDLNSRRGRIQGMDNKAGNTIVKAEVPMAEMLTYGADLTSMTQGRGSFSMEMHHYDTVPQQLQDKIIEKAKAERGEVKEEEE